MYLQIDVHIKPVVGAFQAIQGSFSQSKSLLAGPGQHTEELVWTMTNECEVAPPGFGSPSRVTAEIILKPSLSVIAGSSHNNPRLPPKLSVQATLVFGINTFSQGNPERTFRERSSQSI